MLLTLLFAASACIIACAFLTRRQPEGKAVRLNAAAEIDELNSVKEVTQLCIFYLDLQPEIMRLQVLSVFLDRT